MVRETDRLSGRGDCGPVAQDLASRSRDGTLDLWCRQAPSEDNSIVPSFVEATGDQVYMRFHGRNRDNWFKRNITAAGRYKYLYSERELQSLAKGLQDLEQRGV